MAIYRFFYASVWALLKAELSRLDHDDADGNPIITIHFGNKVNMVTGLRVEYIELRERDHTGRHSIPCQALTDYVELVGAHDTAMELHTDGFLVHSFTPDPRPAMRVSMIF